MAVDARARPIVGWMANVLGGDSEVHVRRLDASGWSDLPGLHLGGFHNSQINVTVGPDDEPLAAWVAGRLARDAAATFTAKVHVAAWKGSSWEELRGADEALDSTDGSSSLPAIAASADGRIGAAWWHNGTELRIRQRKDSAWTTLPSPPAGRSVAIHRGAPAIAFDANGDLVVVWSAASDGGSSVFACRWDGKAWAAYGTSLAERGLSATMGESSHPRLANGPAGPIVAWIHRDDARWQGRSAYVRQWTGSAWEELGGSATKTGLSRGDVSWLGVAADPNGRPIVAWDAGDEDEHDVFAAAWSGTTWVDAAGFGGRRLSRRLTFSTHPAIASRANKTCVTWTPGNGDHVVARCASP